jgi:hypothetical protein
MIFFRATANPFKITFWLLSYILHDPALLSQIHLETQPALADDGRIIDLKHLLEDSPVLQASFDETLRLTPAPQTLVVTWKRLRKSETRFFNPVPD